jgi:hypothetical protein
MGARAARTYLKNLAQRETGNRNISCGQYPHSQVPGLGPRVSGSGAREQLQARGEIQILNLHPNLKTRTRLPGAETRDLKTIASHVCTFAQELRSGLHRAFSPSQSSGLRFPFERSVVPLSTCQLVNLPASVLFWPTNAAVLVHRASGPPGLSLLAP